MKETCENCKHWNSPNEFSGHCKEITGHVTTFSRSHEKMVTLVDFGCLYFKEKEQGPFTSRRVDGKFWVVCYWPSPSGVCHNYRIAQGQVEGEARELAGWLNERWAERGNDD